MFCMRKTFVVSILFIGVMTIHYTHAFDLHYNVVPKSIDYKGIKWQGNIGKCKKDGATIYIRREGDFLEKFNICVEGMLFLHGKTHTNEYHCEYWTKDGFALMEQNEKRAQIKKMYILCKNTYYQRKGYKKNSLVGKLIAMMKKRGQDLPYVDDNAEI